jgi:hypothetical protein
MPKGSIVHSRHAFFQVGRVLGEDWVWPVMMIVAVMFIMHGALTEEE